MALPRSDVSKVACPTQLALIMVASADDPRAPSSELYHSRCQTGTIADLGMAALGTNLPTSKCSIPSAVWGPAEGPPAYRSSVLVSQRLLRPRQRQLTTLGWGD